ncbi:MAG: Gfo/Idh/MocA family oxidoreductase [Crenarchaeota archaeon]|nr:Gfo/Idh/MocA family oxidoreductase [Thermoproteota archaeon]
MHAIKYLVAGLGRIGRLHAEMLKTSIPNAELHAVCDVVEPLAKSVAERLKVRAYTSYDKALSDPEIDAVVIATPTFLHKEMTVKALEAGKHVFLEKPLAPSLPDAKEIANRVKSSGLKFMIGYMRRFDHYYRRAKSLVESGALGRVISFTSIARDPSPPPGWAADPQLSGGIFLDQLSHDFDIARWIVGEVKEVYVVGGNYVSEEIKTKGDLDVVSIIVKFNNDAQGFIHGARRNTFGYDLRTEIYCEKGTIFVGVPMDTMMSIGTGNGVSYGGVAWFEKRFLEAYMEELRHFTSAIIEDEEPLISVDDGLRLVEIAEACWRSYRERKPVSVS